MKKSTGSRAKKKAKRRLTLTTRRRLYAAAAYLSSDAEREVGVQIPFQVYLQDPMVAERDPTLAWDKAFFVNWEPGLADGPTSARFAVVDYDGDTQDLHPPAVWDDKQLAFLQDEQILDRSKRQLFQYHQVNVWARLQNALAFFEGGFGLGRPIPWAFDGNRLIVVPHAGNGRNAFYDRQSKSLQFYYFGPEAKRVYTCLSADIIHHEFAHAILDGIRPHYIETSSVQTAAFHEAMGDLTAILLALRNNEFRQRLAEGTRGALAEAANLSSIAEEFGHHIDGRPYLRSAQNTLKMSAIKDETSAHFASQVLVGAMYDILLAFSKFYVIERGRTAKQAFWDAVQRMQRTVIQPLDLLPPSDVTFRDYALAVLRAERLANPLDPNDYFGKMLKIFIDREILDANDKVELEEDNYLLDRVQLGINHDIDDISRSRAAAYRFLHDNRDDLFVPAHQDFVVADLYDANKLTRQGMRLPRQIIVAYLWREEILLEGARFGRFKGRTTELLCGGTLVFDGVGNVLSWFRKPGTHLPKGLSASRAGKWAGEQAEGFKRRDALLDSLALQLAAQRVGLAHESPKGMLGSRMAPLLAQDLNGIVRFQLSPHLSLEGPEHQPSDTGARAWQLSF